MCIIGSSMFVYGIALDPDIHSACFGSALGCNWRASFSLMTSAVGIFLASIFVATSDRLPAALPFQVALKSPLPRSVCPLLMKSVPPSEFAGFAEFY